MFGSIVFGLLAALALLALLLWFAKKQGYINLTKGDRADQVDDDFKKVRDSFDKKKDQ